VTIQWATLALLDLSRLYEFLAIRNRDAAALTVQALVGVPARLPQNSRIGERLAQFEPREVRRVLVGDYEVRYESRESHIYVLRLGYSREDRP
jgi:plasmid stabilization system protein ParE